MRIIHALKKNKTWDLLVLTFCLMNMGTSFVSEPSQLRSEGGMRKSPLALIYIIEFRDILCAPCSEFFLDFCFSLPLGFQQENTWGIVVYDQDSQTSLGEKIINKKVRGFMNGNQFNFPWCIDFSHMFQSVRTQTTQLLLMDASSLTIKKYAFPLSEKHKNEIIQAVLASL